MTTTLETTLDDVAVLLETFADYVNPNGDKDPWFTLVEINQQFAWEDIPEITLADWLSELVRAGKVAQRAGSRPRGKTASSEWRWLS